MRICHPRDDLLREPRHDLGTNARARQNCVAVLTNAGPAQKIATALKGRVGGASDFANRAGEFRRASGFSQRCSGRPPVGEPATAWPESA